LTLPVVAARRRRCPAITTVARNKGLRYPADPPAAEEIVAVMRAPAIAPTASGCAD